LTVLAKGETYTIFQCRKSEVSAGIEKVEAVVFVRLIEMVEYFEIALTRNCTVFVVVVEYIVLWRPLILAEVGIET
jgi:hypothetical protein